MCTCAFHTKRGGSDNPSECRRWKIVGSECPTIHIYFSLNSFVSTCWQEFISLQAGYLLFAPTTWDKACCHVVIACLHRHHAAGIKRILCSIHCSEIAGHEKFRQVTFSSKKGENKNVSRCVYQLVVVQESFSLFEISRMVPFFLQKSANDDFRTSASPTAEVLMFA